MLIRLFILVLVFVQVSLQLFSEPVKFAIVIPSYNNELWVRKCLESVARQTYKNWHIYYMNDMSEDNTGKLVDRFVARNKIKHKSTIIHNTVRKKSLANLYETIHKIEPNVVVVDLDGDDWLHDDFVLEKLARHYNNPNVWMTYGNYTSSTRNTRKGLCWRFPEDVIKNRQCRTFSRFAIIHLRTFYAKLFQLIKKEDLLWQGDFFPTNGDVAFMFPMLEMASNGHVRYLRDILYVYNTNNPISDFRAHKKLQYILGRYIRKLPPYEPIEELFPAKSKKTKHKKEQFMHVA